MTKIDVDDVIAKQAEFILNKKKLTLSRATNVFLKSIIETHNFPIRLTTEKNNTLFEYEIAELLKHDLSLESIQVIAGNFSSWEKMFNHSMNRQLSIYLKMILDLSKLNAFVFDFSHIDNQKNYWIDNLKDNEKYFEIEISKIEKIDKLTEKMFKQLLEKIVNLLKNDSAYTFGREIRCIELPLSEYLLDKNERIIEKYFVNNSITDIIAALSNIKVFTEKHQLPFE